MKQSELIKKMRAGAHMCRGLATSTADKRTAEVVRQIANEREADIARLLADEKR